MPEVLVRLADREDSWGLVELQGIVDCPDAMQLQGSHIGDLHFDSTGTPQLVIGHHVLTGKVQKLDKPFGVMHRAGEREWEIRAVVQEKFIFKTRPKPIIQKNKLKG